MKDRLITIAGGLLAFALVVVLLVPVQRDEFVEVSRPLSTDRGRAGLQGLQRWLDQGGVQTDVLARRYTALASRLDLSPRGNLLVISLPQHTPSRLDEREALRTWLAQGNSAIVLVAAGDVPRWTMASVASSTREFLESFGFELDAPPESEEQQHGEREASGQQRESRDLSAMDLQAWLEAEPVELVPRYRHPLTRGVEVVQARSVRKLDLGWYLTGAKRGRVVMPLLAEAGAGAAFWEARVGNGRIWVSRYSDLFSNAALGEADNARFVANLVTASLVRSGRVIFDDMHQGATDLYDARAFFADPRFINTMLVMVGFWLLYLVGRSRRLAPARHAVPRYYAADLAHAMAGFFVRRLSVTTVQRQLFAFFFNDIRSRYGLPTNGQPVWSMLSGMSRVSRNDVDALRRHYEQAAIGRKPNLVALARLMQRTRESLL